MSYAPEEQQHNNNNNNNMSGEKTLAAALLVAHYVQTQTKLLLLFFNMIRIMTDSHQQRLRSIRTGLRQQLRRSRQRFDAERRSDLRRRRRRRLFLLSQLAMWRERKVWKMERPHGPVFWANVLTHFTEDQWRQHFRMSRATFDLLLEFVEPHLTRQTTNWRKPLEARLRLAVALWWFANPCNYRGVAAVFGVGTATVCVVVHQVTAALKGALFHRFVCLPSGGRLREVVDGFAQLGYPLCAGAIGCTHVPISTPQEEAVTFFNSGWWHSIILQAVVDHEYCFTNVYVGQPGRSHEAEVLVKSLLYRRSEEQDGNLFPCDKALDVDGVEVPVHIVGDSSYPLRKWLMTEFPDHEDLDQQQRSFNARLGAARAVLEDAFGRLKGRWRCLARRNEISAALVRDVVVACCVLHNICEMNKEVFLPEWNLEPTDFPEPVSVPYPGSDQDQHGAIRDVIMSCL